MRLSEKLAREDADETAQLTLRVKTGLKKQLTDDAEGSGRSVNDLASRLLEAAVALPGWVNVVVDFLDVMLRAGKPLVIDELMPAINEAVRNAAATTTLTSPLVDAAIELKIEDVAREGFDLVINCKEANFVVPLTRNERYRIPGRDEVLLGSVTPIFRLRALELGREVLDKDSTKRSSLVRGLFLARLNWKFSPPPFNPGQP